MNDYIIDFFDEMNIMQSDKDRRVPSKKLKAYQKLFTQKTGFKSSMKIKKI